MKNHIERHIGAFTLLALILLIAGWIRTLGLSEIPEGQFTENDAYLYYWQADIITEQGKLPPRDIFYYIPPYGWNSLAVKLFFQGAESQHFVPVYPQKDFSKAKVKVWEIHYPPNIKQNPKYLPNSLERKKKRNEILYAHLKPKPVDQEELFYRTIIENNIFVPSDGTKKPTPTVLYQINWIYLGSVYIFLAVISIDAK